MTITAAFIAEYCTTHKLSISEACTQLATR